MKRRRTTPDIIAETTATVKSYLEAMDRLAQQASKLAEAEARLKEIRAVKDEQLLTAVTRWNDLDQPDQRRLNELVTLFGRGIAETLLESLDHESARQSKSSSQLETSTKSVVVGNNQ